MAISSWPELTSSSNASATRNRCNLPYPNIVNILVLRIHNIPESIKHFPSETGWSTGTFWYEFVANFYTNIDCQLHMPYDSLAPPAGRLSNKFRVKLNQLGFWTGNALLGTTSPAPSTKCPLWILAKNHDFSTCLLLRKCSPALWSSVAGGL